MLTGLFLEFIVHHWQLFVALFAVLGLIFWMEWQIKAGGAPAISPQMLVEWMNHQNACVIDIRAPETFQKGYIIHSECMNPLHIVTAITQGKGASKYKDKPIVLVCSQGIQSPKIAASLMKDGIARVAVLKGGINAWIEADLPLEKK